MRNTNKSNISKTFFLAYTFAAVIFCGCKRANDNNVAVMPGKTREISPKKAAEFFIDEQNDNSNPSKKNATELTDSFEVDGVRFTIAKPMIEQLPITTIRGNEFTDDKKMVIPFVISIASNDKQYNFVTFDRKLLLKSNATLVDEFGNSY